MKKWALYSYLLANLLDIYTTMLPGGLESNPMMRDHSFHPLIKHIIVIKLLYLLMDSGLLLILYLQLKKANQWFADFIVVCLCIWGSYDFIDTVVQNFAIGIHWWVPSGLPSFLQ
jgi:hypothetical protein